MRSENTYTVDAGIPLPVRLIERYPFDRMEIGASFKVKTDVVKKVRQAACHYAKRNPPAKFSIRYTDPLKKSYRCWRIA